MHEKPVFVTNYPKKAKAFYMKENPDNPDTVLCSDLLAPEGYGEIIGGSQREDVLEKLLHRIREEKLPEESYGWYLDLRKYGSVPHSGLRHRAGAHPRVDLRGAAHPRVHPVPADHLEDLSLGTLLTRSR